MTRGKQVFGAAGYRSAPAAAQGTRWPRRHPKPVPIAGVPGGSRDEIVNLEASGAQTHGIASLEDSLGVSVRVDHDAIKVKRDHAAIERVEDQLSELRRPGPIAGGIGESKFPSREGALPVGTVPSGAPMAVPSKGDPRGVVFLRHFGLGALGVASLRLLVVSDHMFRDFHTPCIRRYLPNGTCLARRATAPQMRRGTITLLALALTHTGALQTGK